MPGLGPRRAVSSLASRQSSKGLFASTVKVTRVHLARVTRVLETRCQCCIGGCIAALIDSAAIGLRYEKARVPRGLVRGGAGKPAVRVHPELFKRRSVALRRSAATAFRLTLPERKEGHLDPTAWPWRCTAADASVQQWRIYIRPGKEKKKKKKNLNRVKRHTIFLVHRRVVSVKFHRLFCSSYSNHQNEMFDR